MGARSRGRSGEAWAIGRVELCAPMVQSRWGGEGEGSRESAWIGGEEGPDSGGGDRHGLDWDRLGTGGSGQEMT